MSTQSVVVLDESFNAGGDLSAAQYHGVVVSANNACNLPTAANDILLGVLQNKPAAAGRQARVVLFGRTKAFLSGTVTAGDHLYLAASGWFVKVTSGYRACGQCIKNANSGYVGEIIVGAQNTGLAVNSVAAGQI